MAERIGMRELARRLGCAPSHVHKLKMRGVLTFGEDGLIEEETARSAIEAARDPQKDHVRDRYAGDRPAAPPPGQSPGQASPGQSPGQASDNTTYHRAKAAREAIRGAPGAGGARATGGRIGISGRCQARVFCHRPHRARCALGAAGSIGTDPRRGERCAAGA